MKQFSLSARLWFPTLLVACVVTCVAAVTAVRTRDSIATSGTAQTRQLDKIQKISVWAGLTEANAARTLVLLSLADTASGARLKTDIESTSTRISALQKEITELARSPAEAELLGRVGQLRSAYVDLRNQLTEARLTGALSDEQITALRGRIEAYTRGQRELLALQHTLAGAITAEVSRSRMQTVYLVCGVMFGLIVLLVLSTAYIARSILQPLKLARQATERIASGDLSGHVDTARTDEIGELMRGLDRMTVALRQLVGDVRAGATGLQSASAEIATGNADLSRRTEQTASNLQETAGSMAQLTHTVERSTTAATQANELASSAAEAAARGGDVVSQVVTNMNEISASSRRIGDIIGVIDGIAFQTNILALNAAVEAARAGEQGRGFAVVATEVRSLAQRSAVAAKEIKTLIADSIAKVEQGSLQVGRTGDTMHEMVTSVKRVTDIMGEVSASSIEQTAGIEQVNSAITQMDQVTQQNAALVEEAAAASGSLREQAAQLRELVSSFKVGQDAESQAFLEPVHSRAVLPVRQPVASDKPAPAKPAKPAAAKPKAVAAAKQAPVLKRPAPVASQRQPAPANRPEPELKRPALSQPAAGDKSTKTAPVALNDDDWEEF